MNTPAPFIEKLETDNGFALVTNFSAVSSFGLQPEKADNHTGHVWAEIQCGMGVHRINITPNEARELASLLVAAADHMEGA